jgi:hypothetical protein
VRVTLVLDDGRSVAREWTLGAHARLTIDLLRQFPWPPAARYFTAYRFGPGEPRPLSAGAAMLATRIR